MKAAWKPEGFFPFSNRNLRVGTSQAMVLNQASWRPGRERQGHWLKTCISGYLPAPEPPGKKGKVLVAQSRLTLCNPMDRAHQAALSMGLSKQEYWSRLPFPCPGDLPDPGIEPSSPALRADS